MSLPPALENDIKKHESALMVEEKKNEVRQRNPRIQFG